MKFFLLELFHTVVIFTFMDYINNGTTSCRDMVCCVAGITSDANVLINELRAIGQRHTLQFGEPIPCEQLVMRLCDIKQAYTQYGGMPFDLFFVNV